MNLEYDFKYFNNETPFFSLKGTNTDTRVVNVIDGDTLVLIIPIFGGYHKFYTRLNGINTCEVHSNNEQVKELGFKAKYRVIELISKKELKNIVGITKKQIIELFDNKVYTVYIECLDFDKYGRLLANVFINNKNLSEILIEEKLGYEYNGDTKLSEEEELKVLS